MIKSPLEGEGSNPSQVEQAAEDRRESESGSKVEFALLLAHLDREGPELAEIVRAWPSLPHPMRTAVLALIRASTSTSAPGR